MIHAVELGEAVGRGNESREIVAALILSFALAMTALQFRAVTSSDRSSAFVRFWAAWQLSAIALFLYVPGLATLFIEGPPRTEFGSVMRHIFQGFGGLVIVFASVHMFRLLRPKTPFVLTSISES